MSRLFIVLLVTLTQGASVRADCGRTPIRPISYGPYIVGGQEARPNSIPWQVSLEESFFGANLGHVCGASIISDRWILTAAHCLRTGAFVSYSVTVGQHSLSSRDALQKSYSVKRVVIHEDWDANDVTIYDIALLELSSPITYNDGVQPVCLPHRSKQWNDEDVYLVAGWGALKEDGRAPDKLQQLMVPHYNHDSCKNLWFMGGDIHDGVICAGYPEGGKDACVGDSGGPLVSLVNGQWVQAGVVSWGLGCARANRPGVYTNVAEYRDWIDNVMDE